MAREGGTAEQGAGSGGVSVAGGSGPTQLEAALERLRCDGSVAFPTETVWGLAARAASEPAMAALRAWKRRSEARPIPLLVSGEAALAGRGFELSSLARQLIRTFWPGPLTLVLPCRTHFAKGVARADGAVGVRCSSHPVASDLVDAAESEGLGPLTATSLNRSGQPPARCEREARLLCGAEPGQPLLLAAAGMDAGGARPSTVLDLCGGRPILLREGAIAAALIEERIGASLCRGDETNEAASRTGEDVSVKGGFEA